MNNHIPKLFFFLLLLVFSAASAQTEGVRVLQKKFDDHRRGAIIEKIYVHVDRNFYVTGESMWFSVYVVDGSFHRPLKLSKVAYVELTDGNSVSVLKAKIELKNGRGSGSFFIPASLQTANYELRAYTSWMRNSDAGYFFRKKVAIANTFAPPGEQAAARPRTEVAFFPEGGDLVAGLKSSVGFSVTDQSGKGISVRGAVLSGADTIVRISTDTLGMGSFSITPEQGRSYIAVFDDRTRHPLPTARETGYVLAARDSGAVIKVEVRNNLGENASPFIYLFAHARQITSFSQAQRFSRGSATFVIPKESLPDGINHLTLFDYELKPRAERLIFNYPESEKSLSIETTSTVGVRRKVTATINAQPGADVSVAVYHLDSLSVPDNQTIASWLWLTSDLPGPVESPGFYFSNHPKAQAAMDNLMLTRGWRRFKWENVVSGSAETPAFVPEYRGHIIKGKVTNSDGEPAREALVYLSSPDKLVNLYPSFSKNGLVKFEVKKFYGPRKIIVQNANDSTHRIEIESPFAELAGQPLPHLTLDPQLEKALLDRSISMQVQDVYFEEYRERYMPPAVDSVAFYGNADETFYLDRFTRFPVMEEVMREYVPGVLVRKRRDGFHFLVLDDVNRAAMGESPLILLDGLVIPDEDAIMAFDPRKVRKLEVMRRPYYLGALRFNGIVSYTTYNGDLGTFPVNPKYVQLDYEGLQLQREFYNPSYATEKQRADRMPDRRTLLYWNPAVKPDTSGAALEFYSSDVEGKYIIVVEGMSEDGQPLHGSTIFSVRSFNK